MIKETVFRPCKLQRLVYCFCSQTVAELACSCRLVQRSVLDFLCNLHAWQAFQLQRWSVVHRLAWKVLYQAFLWLTVGRQGRRQKTF